VLSSIFVERPRLAVVIAVVTAIAGLVSLLVIPIAQLPNIVPPQVSVTAVYPGASSLVVDSTVAQVIESQVVGVDKMIYMKSISGNDGSYSLLASFELGTDPDINTVNVNNRVQIALAKMPEEVKRSGVTVKKKSSALLAVIAVYSPTQAYDELFLSNYVTINLLDQIRSTSGVGDAQLFGPQDYSMRIWLKTDQLTGLGLTTGDVISAIQTQNVQAAVGRIGARPVSDDQQLQLNIQTKGRLSSTEEFEKIIIRSNPDGSVLRLGDIARLQLGAANLDRATRLNGAAATLIGIYQAPGANALRSVDALNKLMADNARSFPEGIAWKVTYDPTIFVRATIEKVKHTLVEAALLVLLVVFIFLGNIRATLIPMIAVPVSLIGTFVVLNAIGYSANTVSLLAMILAIGIVVDDAIVVVEAVEQTMEAHPELSPGEATKLAMQGIFAPIIAITLVLLAVFVPVAFISGISGELFRQFAVTVAVAMFLSAINALTLSPALCAVLLKPHQGPKRGLMGMLSRGIDSVRDGYGLAVGSACDYRDGRRCGGVCQHWAACEGNADRLHSVR
jgi:hydrophobe/amphiphile efflux-1 (HAE1) family protein